MAAPDWGGFFDGIHSGLFHCDVTAFRVPIDPNRDFDVLNEQVFNKSISGV